MAKAGKGLLEGTLQAGTSAVSDKLLDLVGLGGKSAADKGKDFFFTSTGRHTRWNCDWSSDVCSSDLRQGPVGQLLHRPGDVQGAAQVAVLGPAGEEVERAVQLEAEDQELDADDPGELGRVVPGSRAEIGRASCRERV